VSDVNLGRNRTMANFRRKGMKLREIADLFGLSRERVRQIISREETRRLLKLPKRWRPGARGPAW